MTMVMEPPVGGALAKRPYEPLAPVGSPGALKKLIESQRNGLEQMLPRHITPERLMKTLLVAANRTPDIFKCTQASILETINRAAELGLDLSGTLGEAYPIPFNNNVGTKQSPKWVTQLQLIIGYRGLEKLAWQSGEVESIDAEVVYEKDVFIFSKGTEVKVEWTPHMGTDRGQVLGAYACLKLKSGGKLARFLTKDDIEKIRNGAKSKDSPAWRNWWGEMARKCAIKRMLKDAPLSTEKMTKAMEYDGDDAGLSDVLSASTGAGRHARLNARITNRPLDDGQTLDANPELNGGDGDEPYDAGDDLDQQIPRTEPEAPRVEPAVGVVTWNDTLEGAEAAAQEAGLAPGELATRLGKWAVALGVKGKENKSTPQQRLELIEAILTGRLAADGKIVAAS